MFRNNYISSFSEEKVNAVFVLTVVFGFPIIALTNYLFEIQSGVLSQGFRFINLLFSCYLIYKKIINLKIKESLLSSSYKKWAFILFLIFWCIYLIRMFIDLEHYNLFDITSSSKNYFYLYTLGVTFIPMLAAFTIRKIDFNYLGKYLFLYLIVLNICFLFVFVINKFYSTELVGRFVVSRNGYDYFDTISIAVYSGLLIIVSFINLSKSSINYLWSFLGCFLIFSTASRGPILSVILVLLFLIFFTVKKRAITIYLYALATVVFSGVVSYLVSLFFKNNFQGANILLYRLSHILEDDSTASRLKIIRDAMHQIGEAPFFGTHFLVLESKMYAHNIILDILVSTGILGILLIAPMFLFFIKNLINKIPNVFIAAIALFYFINTFTSGACYNMNEFWVIFALVVVAKASSVKNDMELN